MRGGTRTGIVALSIVAFLMWPCGVSFASPPPPGPKPPSMASQRAQAQREAAAHRPKKGDGKKAPASPKPPKSVDVHGLAKPVGKLLKDWAAGKKTKAEVRHMAGLLLPAKDGNVPNKATPRTVPTGCTELCTVARGDHLVFEYPAEDAAGMPDSNGDGIPDIATQTLDVLDRAWTYYTSVLHMTAPDTVTWRYDAPLTLLSSGRAFSAPWGEIDATTMYDVDYLPAHELFHQFQWQYQTSALLSVHITDNITQINWWMEATAEWATAQYAHDELATTAAQAVETRAGYNIPDFFESTNDKLSAGGPWSGLFRQYGAVTVVTFFVQQTGDADFARKTFAHLIGESSLDGTYQLRSFWSVARRSPTIFIR